MRGQQHTYRHLDAWDDIKDADVVHAFRTVPARKDLTTTCRLINGEATPMLYKAVTFNVEIYPKRTGELNWGTRGKKGIPFLEKIENVADMKVICHSAESVVSVANRLTLFVGVLCTDGKSESDE
ncbi:hypothetical protein LTR17_006636 [Elasticomyces elasticus]|nr:hypothetical protein LTR17_006636 [Elasticomyces elasticus]